MPEWHKSVHTKWYRFTHQNSMLTLFLHVNDCISSSHQGLKSPIKPIKSLPEPTLTYCQLKLRNKPQNLNQNTKLSIHENSFKNDICKMLAISSRGIWVNPYSVCVYYQCTCRYSCTVWYWNNNRQEDDFISDRNWMESQIKWSNHSVTTCRFQFK